MSSIEVVIDRPTGEAEAQAGIVDCDIHPAPRDRYALWPYLSKQWQDHLDTYGDPQNGPFAGRNAFPRYMPETARRDAWPEEGGSPGSSLRLMREQHLDKNNVALGILEPLGLGHSVRNLDLGGAVCAAVNDWQVAEFTEPDSRLKASILVAQDDAVGSVKEIERRAKDKAFAQVQMPSLTTEPLGHRRYRPIFEAAAHHGFPVAIHVGGATGARSGSGWPSYYNEEHYALTGSMQAQLTSLVLEGVFEDLPELKLIMIEGGCAWSISLRHRLDRLWNIMRNEAPKLRHPPSHYIKKNVYFSSQPVEEPENPEHLGWVYSEIGWDRMLYASDYPHWDFDDPNFAFKGALTDEQKDLLMRENSKNLYRLL